MKENSQVYMMIASLKLESGVTVSDVPIVRDFPKVF